MNLLNGSLAFVGYLLNTLVWVVPIVILAVLKLLPVAPWQKMISYLLDGCASQWVRLNSVNQRFFSRTRVTLAPLPELSPDDWYLVIANHQSWVDILVLQRVLHGRIPFLKFFLKQQLFWVPFLGLAWWALDFPFMRRYSRQFLEKHPHLKGKDIEATRRACEKFKNKPVSVMNFLEGTRFTPAKYQRQSPPYRQLLSPRAGGIAFALSAMNGNISKLVDVTIYYPAGIPSFWQFISGQVAEVRVAIETREIAPSLIGDYQNDPAFKESFQAWVNELWRAKDQRLSELAGSR